MKSEKEQNRMLEDNVNNILIPLLVMMLLVYILRVAYNNSIPDITKSGSLKLSKITSLQALSLIVVSAILLK